MPSPFFSLLSKLTSLKELQICRMSRLQNITAGALGGLTNLEILRMNYNPRLTNLSPDFLVWQDEDDEEQYPIIKEVIRYVECNVTKVMQSEAT